MTSTRVSVQPLAEMMPAQAINVRSLWRDAVSRLLRNRLSVIGLIFTVIFVLLAVLGPLLAPYDYREQNFRRTNELPSRDYLLGTDDLGRDFLSRVLWGARTAITVGFFVSSIAMALGIILGSLSAYLGGLADWMVGRLIDVTQSIPAIMLAILVNASVKRPSADLFKALYESTRLDFFRGSTYVDYFITLFAIAVVSWPVYARLIRGQILSIREREYVEAARAVGVPVHKILLRHVVPNALGPVIVAVTFGFSSAMILEASLSYLGIGIQEPNPSWGAMINNNLYQLRTRPWLVTVPAVVLGTAALAINYLGDGLNDALNPRTRVAWKK